MWAVFQNFNLFWFWLLWTQKRSLQFHGSKLKYFLEKFWFAPDFTFEQWIFIEPVDKDALPVRKIQLDRSGLLDRLQSSHDRRWRAQGSSRSAGPDYQQADRAKWSASVSFQWLRNISKKSNQILSQICVSIRSGAKCSVKRRWALRWQIHLDTMVL